MAMVYWTGWRRLAFPRRSDDKLLHVAVFKQHADLLGRSAGDGDPARLVLRGIALELGVTARLERIVEHLAENR